MVPAACNCTNPEPTPPLPPSIQCLLLLQRRDIDLHVQRRCMFLPTWETLGTTGIDGKGTENGDNFCSPMPLSSTTALQSVIPSLLLLAFSYFAGSMNVIRLFLRTSVAAFATRREIRRYKKWLAAMTRSVVTPGYSE